MKEIFKKILTEWQESVLPVVTKRSYTYDKKIDDILAVIWPRRAGKTYFMYQIIEELILNVKKEDIVFINFEDYRIHHFTMIHFSDIIDAHYELYGKKPKYLFFDEIQNIRDYGKALRTFKDQWYRIIISWSSSKLLIEEISTELRGRYSHILMLPLSFREILTYRNFDTKNIEYSLRKGDLMNEFTSYLENGWFPALLDKNLSAKKKTLENYYETIFYKDVLERHSIKARFLFEYLMKYVLDSYATTFSIGKFHEYLVNQKIEWSKKTLANYFHHLEEAFFMISVDRFSFSPRKSLLSPKKIYLSDNGFTLLSNNYSDNLGKKLENLYAIHLFRNEKQFYYFQKKWECDFVIKNGNSITETIQVCYELTFENREREIKWLLEAMGSFDLQEWVIITYDQEETIIINDVTIRIIPLWKVFLAE